MKSSKLQHFRMWAVVVVAFGLAGVSISSSTIANAHTTLVSSTPSNGEVVKSWPNEIVLTFAEDLQTIKNQEVNFVSVSNANGQDVTGNTSVTKNVVTTTLKANDIQGLVLVNYRVAAQDGHIVEGEFTFTNGKSSEVTPNSSPIATVVIHQGAHSHTGIYATTTVLIVLALLFGLWIYKRD